MTGMIRAGLLGSCAVLGLAHLPAGPARAQGLDARADSAAALLHPAPVQSLSDLLGPVEAEARPDPALHPFAGFDEPDGGIDPDLWSDMGNAAPADAATLPAATPAQASGDTVAPFTPPGDWAWQEVSGVRYAVPPGWTMVEDSEDGRLFFRGDMEAMRGVTFAVGFESDIDDIRDEDGLQVLDERDVTLDGQTLHLLEILGDNEGVTMQGQILFTRHLMREDESLMIAMVASNEPFAGNEALLAQILGTFSLPARPAAPAAAPQVAAPVAAQQDVDFFMRMVRLTMPGDWSRGSVGEFTELISPQGGFVRFYMGREALPLIAAIPPGTGSIPVWLGNAPATEYALPEGPLTVWDTCPYPNEPLVMQITGPAGFDAGAGVGLVLATMQIAFPPDAAHCGAAIIPGQGNAAAADTVTPAAPAPASLDAADVDPGGEDTFIDDPSGYTTYRNARYGMEIRYPGAYFTPDPAPGNGDGRRFAAVDGQAEFIVFSQYDALGEGLDAMLATDRAALAPLTDARSEPGAYQIAGQRDGRAALRRVIMDSDGLTRTFEISYPPARSAEFAAVIAFMADSFGPPPELAPVSVPVPQPPSAIAVPQPPASPPGQVALPQPPDDIGDIPGTWAVNANSYTGTLVLRRDPGGLAAVLNLGSRGGEILRDVIFDPATGQITFHREAGTQNYRGTLTGDRLEGEFSSGPDPSFRYRWHADLTEPAPTAAAPRGDDPTATPGPAFPASATGLWAINANGHRSELRLAFGPDWLSGFMTLGGGRDEILEALRYDPASGQVEFTRPLGASTQQYIGLVTSTGIEGRFNQGGGQYTYLWSASLIEADDFIPDDIAPPTAAAPQTALPAGPVTLGTLRIPARGTAERDAIIDTARAPIQREIGLPVIFVISTLNTDGTWAYLQGTPVNPDGTRLDWSRSNFAREMAGDMMSDTAMVLMRNDGTGWRVVDHVMGPTDVHWIGWMEEIGLPEALFYP